ncbi:MAG: hypothetical protein M3N57_09160 [Actinomycetota bacterium]|nr:hypothetical protein [Actinomycetota bacterium]
MRPPYAQYGYACYHLQVDYPVVQRDLNHWLPLVKWLLAIPLYHPPFSLS